jgi:signal transduction histidine kinase
VKHAGVKEAIVRLGVSNGMLQLEVEDHGSGITASPSRRGLGIIGMRERAALVGGTIEFLRPAGGGTLVRLCVPMVGAHV